jgi:DNA transformation protein
MPEAQELATHIVDLLESFGPCEARRMFGGFGIFHQELMFALIAGGSLYLKADDETRELFATEGSTAFSYYKKEKEYRLSYYLAPVCIGHDLRSTPRCEIHSKKIKGRSRDRMDSHSRNHRSNRIRHYHL